MDAKYALTEQDPLRVGLMRWWQSVECKRSGGGVKDVPKVPSTSHVRAADCGIQTSCQPRASNLQEVGQKNSAPNAIRERLYAGTQNQYLAL